MNPFNCTRCQKEHVGECADIRATIWTPTTDRLPDDDQCVLIAMEDGEVWTGFHADDRWFYVSADPVGSPVTHWCDFPEPPSNVEHNRRPQSVRVDGPVGPQAKEKT